MAYNGLFQNLKVLKAAAAPRGHGGSWPHLHCLHGDYTTESRTGALAGTPAPASLRYCCFDQIVGLVTLFGLTGLLDLAA